MIAVIEKIVKHAARIKAGQDEQVRPGTPARFTAACQPGDGIWQGDLGLEIVGGFPADYVKGKAVKKLVPDDTQGSQHCLDSLEGVVMWFPNNWSIDSLQGPCFTLTKERTVLHPTHGLVTIPAGFTILCRYQREWDREQKKLRRARD